jgi:hypothetical protein
MNVRNSFDAPASSFFMKNYIRIAAGWKVKAPLGKAGRLLSA